MRSESFRKHASSSMIVCYRSVVRHPFLVGMILFLFTMYRLFPLLFSVVVSASPVLVSTAVLLGTLLSFGQPNIPEIETEAEIQRLESEEVVTHAEIVARDASFEVADKVFGEMPDRVDDADKVFEEMTDRVDDGLLQSGEGKSEGDEEKVVLGSHYTPLQQSEDEHIVLESDKLWEGSADPLNSNSGLLWKGMEGNGGGNDDDEDEDDDGSDSGDSGSDLAESSSPDASMADIIPLLDELHPLLSEEQDTRQPSHMSHDGTDALSEHSLESSDTSSESNADIENHENLKTGDDEDEDEDKEFSEHIDKEDDARSAITWTEYDQKNLMNLGTSEMERNRRLENLIARRRARRTMRMQAEKNLIDLESADLPWNIPPISTSRNNPFDYDANDNIPGSAPSVLLQRRNPFDLPYDSSEEKPDLVGDTFQQEFAVFQPKEPFFRRHESFNVGPSNFAVSRSDRQESKLKPYFVPERSFASFQRQFSGLSDSKASSVPDTESVSSDIENKDHNEEDEHSVEAEHASEIDEHVSDHVIHGRPYFVPEHVASDETSFSSFQRQLSEVSDSKVSSEADTESVSSAGDLENKDHIDLSLEPDLISLEDHEHASEIIEHVSPVSESFEEDGNVDPIGLDDAEIIVENVTNQRELHSSVSSLSSFDEASEQIYNEKEGEEVMTESVSETNYFLDRGNSIERSEIDVSSSLVEESQPNEPVYDLSPRSVTRNLSSSSINLDLHKDESSLRTDDHNQSSSSASDVKWNSMESSSETVDAQNELPGVPDNEEHVLAVDNISTSLPNKPVLEAEDVVLDLGASHEEEQVQVSSSNSHARSHASFHLEDVTSLPDEESLLSRSSDKPLTEDPEEPQQVRDHEHGEVALLSYEAQFTEVVHGEKYENHSPTHGEDISQPQKEFPLLDTSVDNPSEDDPEVLLVQTTSNNSDNLQMQEPDIVEVTDKAQEIPAYASDTQSIENNVDDLDEIKEIDEDLLVELDAVGDFSVNDFGSILNEMKEDPHMSKHDLEYKGIADEDSYHNDLESNLSEMKQYSHVSEHDLETSHSLDEDSYPKDPESIFNEMKQKHDIETKLSGDVDFDSKDFETTLDERKQDPYASDHDLETMISGDEDKNSKVLGSTLDEMKQDTNASDHDLETRHSEEIKQDPPTYDLETKHSEDEDSYSKDAILGEMKEDPHASDETKHSEDEVSYSKVATLDEVKQDLHESSHDLETKHSEDEDSYSKDATLHGTKQDPHDSNHELETKHSEDEDSYSKDATLDETKHDLHDSDHDLETKHSGDEDEDSYSNKLGSTLDEMKQDPHALDHDLETNHVTDEDSYSRDLDTTFNEMKRDSHALEHRIETFYSVDENFYAKHVESTFNEMKRDLQASDQDLETNRSAETKSKLDAEVIQSQNENDISDTKAEGANESLLPQENVSTTSIANSTSATMVSHETENASSTSNTDKE
ncbi:hypothetical protein SSX86_004260 [Deinandra increscens subsp. villosa]|uniref:Uncharacterized protein n=1 Tax=Deinandra increscens subsp. villosa TaxID=3103831 RepID=A0AAP0HAR6_9ASTR